MTTDTFVYTTGGKTRHTCHCILCVHVWELPVSCTLLWQPMGCSPSLVQGMVYSYACILCHPQIELKAPCKPPGAYNFQHDHIHVLAGMMHLLLLYLK